MIPVKTAIWDLLKSNPWPFLIAIALILLLVLSLVYPKQEQHSYVIEIPEVDFGEMPDFASISDVGQMKAEFFDYLEPIVSYHNQLIQQQRAYLLEIDEEYRDVKHLKPQQLQFLQELSDQYEVDWDNLQIEEVLALLERRVDIIPPPLAQVQAAKESGWGRSRFAVEANNLFGQWCYSRGCGLVPDDRNEESNHEVKYFESVEDAIYSYMNNLNTHPSYTEFRDLREELRKEEEPITGATLADGLIYYSQRRQVYVDEIKTMLRQYHKFQAERDS